jgi:hypothetical protein
MKDKSRASLPEHQRELLVSFGKFLRGHAQAAVAASRQLNRGPAAFLLYALLLRVLQLGRAVQELCIVGHALEAQMIARPMVSAALSMLLVAEADGDARALLFAQFQRKLREQRSAALVKHGHLTQQRADALEAAEAATDDQALAAHAAAGTRPAKPLGSSRLTWSGLSDRALAKRFHKSGWYELFYGPMSDQSHVNAAAIGVEISSILQSDVTIGGRFDSPFLVVVAACETASHACEVIDQYFSIGSAAERAAIDTEMKRAIDEFVRQKQP